MFKKNLLIILSVIVISIISIAIMASAANPPMPIIRGGTGINSIPNGYSLWGNNINSITATSSLLMNMNTGNIISNGIGLYNPVTESMDNYNEDILETFQSGHGWTYYSGDGTLTDDTSDYVIGSQSIKMTASTTQGRIQKINISPTFSIKDKNIKIVAKIANSDSLDGGNQQIFIGFSDNNFNNYLYYNINYPLRKTEPGGEWLTMIFSAPDYFSGTIDRTAINSMRIYLRGTDNPATVLNINKISLVDKPKEPIITFTFDDGPISQYAEGKRILSKYGYPATAYVIRDRETDSDYLSLAQMTELQDVHGWDISGHSETNFTTLTADELETEMLEIKNYLLKNGFHKGADHLAYPQGELNSNIVLPLMRKYFTSGRLSAAGQQEALPVSGSPYLLKPFSCQSSVSTSTIFTEIDQAIEERSWLILVFHKLVENPSISTEYSINGFQDVVDYVASKNVKVKTISDVINSNNPNYIEMIDNKVGIGTTSPTQTLSVNGNILADGYLEYSDKYIGNALKKIKEIKCEKGSEKGDWCKIDHNTLPQGIRYEKDNFIGRNLGASVQFNLKSIQELYDLSLQQQAEIGALKMRLHKIDNLGIDPVIVNKDGKLLSHSLWAGFGATLTGLIGAWFLRRKNN